MISIMLYMHQKNYKKLVRYIKLHAHQEVTYSLTKITNLKSNLIFELHVIHMIFNLDS